MVCVVVMVVGGVCGRPGAWCVWWCGVCGAGNC